MDQEFLRFLAPMGVGGVLAAFIFYFYRRDLTRDHAQDITRLMNGAIVTKEERGELIRVISANTQALIAVAENVKQNRDILSEMREFCKYKPVR